MEEICKNWSSWLLKTRFAHLSDEQREQTLRWLFAVRDAILESADIKQGEKIIDIGTGTGLLGFGVLERFRDNVELIFSDKFEDCLIECEKLLKECNFPNKASFLQSDCLNIKLADNYVDKALMRSVMVHVLDKQSVVNEIHRILKPGGAFCAFEPIISSNTRYHELVGSDAISDYEDFKRAENEFMSDEKNPLTNFNQDTLAQNLETAGFSDGSIDVNTTSSSYVVDLHTIDNWLVGVPSPGEPSMKDRFLRYFDAKKVDNYIQELKNALDGQVVNISSNTVFLKAIK